MGNILCEDYEAIVTRDKLFSIIAHDLSGIFGGLQNLAELLMDKKTQFDTQARESWLKMLMQAASNGYDLLTNLLNLSRLQTSRLRINPTTIALRYLMVRNVESQHEKAYYSFSGKKSYQTCQVFKTWQVLKPKYLSEHLYKGIEIVADVDENQSVYTDANMLNIVLRNLISNAIKFTKVAGTIRVIAKQIEGNLVEIPVSDTGIGIKPENIDILYTGIT